MTSNSTICKDKLNSRNMVNLLVMHTKLCHLPQGQATGYPPVRAVALQCLSLCLTGHTSEWSSTASAPWGPLQPTQTQKLLVASPAPVSPLLQQLGVRGKGGERMGETHATSAISPWLEWRHQNDPASALDVDRLRAPLMQTCDRGAAVVHSFVPGTKRKEETFATQQTKAKYTARGCWTISVHNENSWLG